MLCKRGGEGGAKGGCFPGYVKNEGDFIFDICLFDIYDRSDDYYDWIILV